MKRRLLTTLILLNLFAGAAKAQDVLNSVPANASLVIKYAAGKLTQKLPAQKFDSYTFLKKKFLNALLPDKNTSLASTGINLDEDAYQYLVSTDTTINFVTLVNLKNEEKFAQLVQKKNKTNITIEKKNGYQFYPLSTSVYVAWNSKMAALVVTSYTTHDYYHSPVSTDTATMYDGVGKMNPYSDSSIALEKSMPVDSTMITLETTENKVAMDSAAVMVDSLASISEPVTSTVPAEAETEQQKADREASDLFYVQQQTKKDSIQKVLAVDMLTAIYNGQVTSIKNEEPFAKLADKDADISFWLDSTSLLAKLPYAYAANPLKFNYSMMPGYPQSMNVYFEKDKVKMEQQIYIRTAEDNKLFQSVYNSRQNPAFINYLQPSDIGFLSMSINSEALMNFYYGVAKKIIKGMPYIGKDSDLTDTYIDILEILFDEKAIADVLPGNALFVMHSIKPKKVKYITYDYDVDYNGKQVEKTKTEMSPDFTFVFDTRNEKIFNKLINLPVKLNKDTTFKYTKTGSFYTLDLGENNLLGKMYFMVKDGRCTITTSLADVNGNDKAAASKPTLDAAASQAFLNSNYYGNLNFKSLLSAMATEITDKKNQKMLSYMQANAGNITLESSIKDNLVKTTTLLNIKGKHTNSLEYFFNVIENLLKIDAGGTK